MSESRRLADAIVRTVTGPMWHGPALGEVLRGIAPAQAGTRVGQGAHTIWELVLHITAWVDISHDRVRGAPHTEVPADQDWPAPPSPSEEAWQDAVAVLAERHSALAETVTTLTDDALRAKVVGHDYTVRVMLHGVIEHGTYHGGQIAILRKLLTT